MSKRKNKSGSHQRTSAKRQTVRVTQQQAVQPQMNFMQNWVGMPVCTVLKDGTVLYGTLSSIDKEGLLLHGIKGKHKIPRSSTQAKAQVTALGGLGQMFGGLGGLGGGSGAGAGAVPGGGLGSMFGGLFGGRGNAGGGFLGNVGNWFRIGMGVVKFVFPLLKGFGF